jgi:hypothetical protein
MAIYRQLARLSFDETKGIQYFPSELRPSFAGWPNESEHVIPANTAHIALEESVATTNVLFFLPGRPPGHRELSDGLILGCRHALKLPERNIARL